jgi:3-demethoxyubiquinol 3-hydroxylase
MARHFVSWNRPAGRWRYSFLMALQLSLIDRLTAAADRALRTVAAPPAASRPSPASRASAPQMELSDAERREAAALMRVNHVGEVCAQALYDAQALATRDRALRTVFEQAAREETDHLAWTQARIEQLGGRTSLLNPLWYGGAFAIGLLAARAGDRVSLGFMAETERQVEQHLDSHLDRLPADDHLSRAVVERMKDDEVHHAESATALGGAELPLPARWLMKVAAKVMTTTAHYI